MDYTETIKSKRLAKLESDKQSAFVNSIEQVSSDIRQLLSSLETSGAKKLDTKVVEAISSLSSIVDAIKLVKIDSDDEVKNALKTIASILNGLDVRPIVNVPQPKVIVNEKKIDFDPIVNAINNKPLPNDDPLSGYKAQDIGGTDPHVQYIGFVNSKGNWYIIENDDTSNSLRYVFGIKNYKTSFANASKLNYKLFNEAINAKI